MKSYTDIEQSKKLAEILPAESADMWYDNDGESIAGRPEVRYCSFIGLASMNIPCWSLAALLDLMQIDCKIEKTAFDQTNEFTYSIWADYFNINTDEYDELVDACYEMIVRLKEKNLL